jgi:hypothetical protein
VIGGRDDRLALLGNDVTVDEIDVEHLALVHASHHQSERPGGHPSVNPRATRFGHLNSSGCTTFWLRLVSPH